MGCSYLESVQKLSNRGQNVLYFVLGGNLSCPRCSTPGNVVIHKIEYKEDETNGQVQI